jgi:hypothetical protein
MVSAWYLGFSIDAFKVMVGIGVFTVQVMPDDLTDNCYYTYNWMTTFVRIKNPEYQVQTTWQWERGKLMNIW